MDSFTWKDENSFDDYGIIINKRPSNIIPERNIEETVILGRNGSLVTDYGTYKDIDLQFTCTLKDFSRIYEVKAWLSGFDKLSFSWDSDKYYNARLTNRIDIADVLIKFKQFPLFFKAQPFAYSLSDNIITLTTAGSINNIGTWEAEPIIKIYGSGNIDLTINNNIIHLTNVVDYITIDSALQDCYKDTALCNNQMSGDFPKLQVGNNGISWTGTVTKVEITPNWRWI